MNNYFNKELLLTFYNKKIAEDFFMADFPENIKGLIKGKELKDNKVILGVIDYEDDNLNKIYNYFNSWG